ncbi:31710_t:CDS:1, partial [Racocetra persica]
LAHELLTVPNEQSNPSDVENSGESNNFINLSNSITLAENNNKKLKHK